MALRKWIVRALAALAAAALLSEAMPPLAPKAEAQIGARRDRAEAWRERRQARRIVRLRRFVLWRAAILARRRAHPELFEESGRGLFVLRAQVLAIDPGAQSLAIARRLGFVAVRERSIGDLGVRIVVLRAPPGVRAGDALAMVSRADPNGSYELNHVFDPSQGAPSDGTSAPMPIEHNGAGLKLGMIDGGVDVHHPALVGARVHTEGFAGAVTPSPHGSAIASLLVGVDGDFHGAAPGADLLAADVFGEEADGGSAEAIAEALGWLAHEGVSVVNLSFEGPPNRLLETVCRAATARGIVLVAAAGNAGPTAPVAYPGAYPGVVAVTAVDGADRVYLSANRGPQISFAALGVNVEAASEDDAYDIVSGTSFAVPIVAVELALLRRRQSSAQTIATLAERAQDLGAPGRDVIYGYGRVPATALRGR